MTMRYFQVLTAILFLTFGLALEADGGARRSRPLKTGDNACWDKNGNPLTCDGTGQDGELQRGEPRAYSDNGDGTIRDRRTALTWEKLSRDFSYHNVDLRYSWDLAHEKIADLNTEPCFAGFCDWRLPNVNELQTLVDYGRYPPIDPIFESNCVNDCTVLSCSCTASPDSEYPYYWTSTASAINRGMAMIVGTRGDLAFGIKGAFGIQWYVRAVRGGSR